VDPAPLEVNTLRLLAQFHSGSLTLAETWARFLAPDNCAQVLSLAGEAGALAEAAAHKLGLSRESGEGTAGADMPSTDQLSDAVAGFHFPDDLWARVFYDVVVAASFGDLEVERLVAAFVPIYFGRVGSLVVENRHVSEEQAEEHVERQAREFELRKPYLVERWQAARAAGPPRDPGAAGPKGAR
jgi:hypothetical protein